MKKFILFAACVLTATASFSQMHYGVQVSANFSTADLKSADITKLTKDAKTLSGATVVGSYDISKNISLRTSLGLLQKGVNLSGLMDMAGGGSANSSSLTTSLN